MSPPGAIVNIAGLTPVDDPEYRYKMPSVFGKIEGRGNGIKTVVPNISDVATSLHRPPGEVNKFFGCELGAQTSYNSETDKAIVNGAHTDVVLQQLMARYIEIFVLCPQCGLPETNYKIKSDTIWHRCAACGAKEMVDMSHKLCTYILAQDKKRKQEEKKSDKKSKKKDKDGEKKKDKDKKSKKKDKDDSDEDKKKKKKDKKDKKEKKKKDKTSSHEEKKQSDIADELDDLSIEDAAIDDSGMIDMAVDATKKFMVDNPEASVNEVVDVVINQQMASALKSHHKVLIFVRAAITSDFFKKKEIKQYAPIIAKLTNSNPIMERHLIAAFEAACVGKPKNFPVMIKQLYDEDALEEEVILEWAGEGRSEYTLDIVDEETRAMLRGEAEPVVVWLQEADSDESDEE